MIQVGNISSYASEDNNGNIFLHGKVIKIIEDTTDETNQIRSQKVLVRIKEKKYNNKEIVINSMINLCSIHKIIVQPNDKIIVWADLEDISLENCKIYSYGRDLYSLYLIGIFVLLILLIGGKKGISSLFSLSFTLLLIFIVFFPMIIKGANPIITALIICLLSTIFTLLINGGFSVKTYSAIIGTLGGIIFSIFIVYQFGALTHIKGIEDDSVELLAYFPKECNFDFKDLLYAGIIIGTSGAVMDICMSIASAMDEINEANPRLSGSDLFIAGMRIGKDVLGTMTNTLILAYVGSSINLLLVYYIYGLTLTQFINGDQIACEILRSFSGSIGLVLSIPITTISYLIFRNKKMGLSHHHLH
jgi:uncharacterized membrane protein